jgi:hypothetical protein
MMGGVHPKHVEQLMSHRSGRQPKTYVKPEAAITVFELLMMGGVSPETCSAIKEPSQRPAAKNVCKTRGCNYSF